MYLFNVDFYVFEVVGNVSEGVEGMEVIGVYILYVGDVEVDDF